MACLRRPETRACRHGWLEARLCLRPYHGALRNLLWGCVLTIVLLTLLVNRLDFRPQTPLTQSKPPRAALAVRAHSAHSLSPLQPRDLPFPARFANLVLPPSLPPSDAAAVYDQELRLETWHSRKQSFLNIFLVWTSHRDTWGAVQDRVVSSLVATIPAARVRVLSNSLPRDQFYGLAAEGYDVAVAPFELDALLRDVVASTWLHAVLASDSPHRGTHLADFVRLAALYRYGGLYVDTDALWLRNVADLPEAFIGKIDFLRFETVCTWCLDGRWYLANGVMSFPAKHPFLAHLLSKIDSLEYTPDVRTAIGPQFVTTVYLTASEANRGGIALLEEGLLYPISGADVPSRLSSSVDAESEAVSLLTHSYSAHLYAHTFGSFRVDPVSVFARLLKVSWPAQRAPLCRCAVSEGALCVPLSAVIEYGRLSSPWFWPSARLCVVVIPAALAETHSLTLVVSAAHGVVRTWGHSPARQLSIQLRAPHWLSDELSSLEYRHVGGYCNDAVTVVLQHGSGLLDDFAPVVIPISSPCFTVAELAAPPADLRTPDPINWNDFIGPEVPSLTSEAINADAQLHANFTRCTRTGALTLLKRPLAVNSPLRVGLLVSATGSYLSWVDGLVASAETYFFRGAEVHYFILSDRPSLPLEPLGRVHLLSQPRLGWPYDSMFRHQLYLKHRAAFAGMDFLMVLDADAVFVRPVGMETLGETVGALQAFFFGQAYEAAPFERDPASSSFIPPAEGACYYAGGLFGGSYEGFVGLLQQTSWLAEWDIAALGRTAAHDDESYLNKAFLLAPPAVSLSGNYIYPEPPADRAWGLRGVNWAAAFPPRIHNLGARKWFGQTSSTDRLYLDHSLDSMQMLTATHEKPAVERSAGMAHDDAPSRAAVAVCTSLSGSPEQRRDWVRALLASVHQWHSPHAQVVVVDTSAAGDESAPHDPAAVHAANGASGAPALYIPYSRNDSAVDRSIRGRVRSAWQRLQSSLRRSRGPASPCPLEALQLALEHVTEPTVLLLDSPSVLTWQANLAFLQEQVDTREASTIVVTCRRRAARPRAACVPQPPPAGATATAGVVPPWQCSPCDTASPEQMNAEVRGVMPVVDAVTPLRRLSCWAAPSVRGHAAIVADVKSTESLLREYAAALASRDSLPQTAPAALDCGIDCLLSDALELQASRRADAHTPDILRCVPDMRPLLLLQVPSGA